MRHDGKPFLSLLLVGFLFGCVASIPQAQAETVTQTRYLGSGGLTYRTWDELDFLWLRNLTEAWDNFNWMERNSTNTYNGNIQIGLQVYRTTYDVDYYFSYVEELTSGIILLWEKANNFEGWTTTTWTSLATNLTERSNSLFVMIYIRFKTGISTWSNWLDLRLQEGDTNYPSYFITECLGMDKLLSSDWNFTFYLKCWRETTPLTKRIVRIYLGNSTYNSRISNMQFDNGITTTTEDILSPTALALSTTFAIPYALCFALIFNYSYRKRSKRTSMQK